MARTPAQQAGGLYTKVIVKRFTKGAPLVRRYRPCQRSAYCMYNALTIDYFSIAEQLRFVLH